MRHARVAVSVLLGVVACSSGGGPQPDEERAVGSGASARRDEPRIPAGPVPVSLPTAEPGQTRRVPRASAFVTIKADGAIAFGKLAPGPAPYDGARRDPDRRLADQIAEALAPPPIVAATGSAAAGAGSTGGSAVAAASAPDADPRAARPQAIDRLATAGILGTLRSGSGGGFASLTGTFDDDAVLGGLIGGPGGGGTGWGIGIGRSTITVRGILESIGTLDVIVLGDAGLHLEPVLDVVSQLDGQRIGLAVAGAGAPDALVYRFGDIAPTKSPPAATVVVTADGAIVRLEDDTEQSFTAPFVGRTDRPGITKALAAVADPPGASVAIQVGHDATLQQVVDALSAAAAAKIGGVALAVPREGGATGFGYGRGRLHGRAPSVGIGTVAATGDLDKGIIQRYIRRNIARIRLCYERRLVDDPSLGGTVVVKFYIAPTGEVQTATATGFDAEVAACIERVVRAIRFPKPRGGGGVQVSYPFTFRATP